MPGFHVVQVYYAEQGAYIKTRNNETKRPKRNRRNNRNGQNERNEAKSPKQAKLQDFRHLPYYTTIHSG